MSKKNKKPESKLSSSTALTQTRGHIPNGSEKMTGSMKACAYMRTAIQNRDSIQIQREALLDLAEREGYEIIQWYVDEGCSGSNKIKRPAWLKLLAEAPTAEWTVVLLYNRSRFSRLDSIEEVCAKQVLRDAQKKLHTVQEGLVEWMTATGRIVDAIRTEESHQYAAKLAQASLRGKLCKWGKGRHVGGTCPYGYAFLVTDPHGNTHRISRKENIAVPKGWEKALVPGDPEEVEVVRWLFQTFAQQDVSLRWLARDLNARSVPAPRSEKWLGSTVVHLLANDAYVGDTRFGRISSGRFARLNGDKVVAANPHTPVEQQDGLVRHNTHEGVIGREVWDRVQEKLNRGSK